MLKSFKQILKCSFVCSLLNFYKTNEDHIRSVFIRNVKVKEDKKFDGFTCLREEKNGTKISLQNLSKNI